DRALRHAVGEFLDGDRLGDDDFAHQLLARLVGNMPLEALGAAAERCDRPLAHVVGIERGDDGEAATLLLRAGPVRRFRRCDGTHCTARTATNLARTLVVICLGDDARRADGRRRTGSRRALAWGGGRRLALAKALLGFELGLALGFLVGAMALFFSLAARFGRFTFCLLDAFAACAALGFLFGNPPFLDLARARIGQ